jgi:hypothetical protein
LKKEIRGVGTVYGYKDFDVFGFSFDGAANEMAWRDS